jgi:hypothetical protein
MFYRIDDFADDLLAGRSNGKYTPVEVAGWIETYAAAARAALAQADVSARGRNTPAYRRAKIDIQIQTGIGEFFAAKFRSGVLFRLYSNTKDRSALEESVASYRKARAAWAELAEIASAVYMSDITLGEEPQLRGHWSDRLQAIDNDIAAVAALLSAAPEGGRDPAVAAAIGSALGSTSRKAALARHEAAARFERGNALNLRISGEGFSTVRLHYRHVNQGENYETLLMDRQDSGFAGSIPAAYTQTKFPLEYFFEITSEKGDTVLYPGFDSSLTNQPYYVVRSI